MVISASSPSVALRPRLDEAALAISLTGTAMSEFSRHVVSGIFVSPLQFSYRMTLARANLATCGSSCCIHVDQGKKKLFLPQ